MCVRHYLKYLLSSHVAFLVCVLSPFDIQLAVADPGFDLRGVDFVNGGGGAGRKSSESVVG